ncbi:MAG: ribonuclease P protein component [Prevotellaceae bacterium]|jgi:ribonuclease P protein component|nr:ribonuclease P protein component [Prevotellaceae bacterium]
MKKSLSAAEVAATFARGKAFFSYPVKMLADVQPLAEGGEAVVKTAFTVPKRTVKKATARNRLKRQLRAAFQRQEMALRETFLATPNTYNLVFMYCDSKKEAVFATLEKSIYENVKAMFSSSK